MPCFVAWLLPLTFGDCSQGKRLLQEQGWKGPALDKGAVKETQRWQLPVSSPYLSANPDRKPSGENRLPLPYSSKYLLQHLPDNLILPWMAMDELSSWHDHSVNVSMPAAQHTTREMDGDPFGFPQNKTVIYDSVNFPQHQFPVLCNRWRMSVLCGLQGSFFVPDGPDTYNIFVIEYNPRCLLLVPTCSF